MKFCFFLICILSYSTTYSKVELHVDAGIGLNSRPYYKFDRMLTPAAKPTLNIAGSADVLYNVGKWQIGAGIHIQQMSRKDGSTTYVNANPAYIVCLIGNRKVGGFYYGIGIGYLVRSQYDQIIKEEGNEKAMYVYNGNGLNTNLHAGYSKYFGKFGIIGQLNGNFVYASDKFIMSSGSSPIEDNYKFGYFHYSFLIGVGYRF